MIHRLAIRPKSPSSASSETHGVARSYAETGDYNTIRLDAFVHNPTALGFYEHLGYRQAGPSASGRDHSVVLRSQLTNPLRYPHRSVPPPSSGRRVEHQSSSHAFPTSIASFSHASHCVPCCCVRLASACIESSRPRAARPRKTPTRILARTFIKQSFVSGKAIRLPPAMNFIARPCS